MNFDDSDGSQHALPSDALDGKISARSPNPSEIVESAIGANDVLCGRGKTSFGHAGNRRFRDVITASIDRYNRAGSRLQKSLVVHEVVQRIHSIGGRFLKRENSTGRWVELDDRQAKDKCGHALRDAISSLDSRKRKRSPSLEEGKSCRRSSSSTSEMKMESPVDRVTMQDAADALFRPTSHLSPKFPARSTSNTSSILPVLQTSELLPRHTEPRPMLTTSQTAPRNYADLLPRRTESNYREAQSSLPPQAEPRPLHPRYSHSDQQRRPANGSGVDDAAFVEHINDVLGPFQQPDSDDDPLSGDLDFS